MSVNQRTLRVYVCADTHNWTHHHPYAIPPTAFSLRYNSFCRCQGTICYISNGLFSSFSTWQLKCTGNKDWELVSLIIVIQLNPLSITLTKFFWWFFKLYIEVVLPSPIPIPSCSPWSRLYYSNKTVANLKKSYYSWNKWKEMPSCKNVCLFIATQSASQQICMAGKSCGEQQINFRRHLEIAIINWRVWCKNSAGQKSNAAEGQRWSRHLSSGTIIWAKSGERIFGDSSIRGWY